MVSHAYFFIYSAPMEYFIKWSLNNKIQDF